MRSLKRRMSASTVALLMLVSMACAKAPVTASPQGKLAFYQNQTYKALGEIRNVAVSANDTTPPLIDRNTMRKIVMWEDSAIVTIHAATTTAGWKPVVSTGLDELMKDLTPAEQNLIRPYVTLAKALIQEVP